jgi:hypothetical protein
MKTPNAELRVKVESQRTLLPGMYGGIDFTIRPERFTVDPDAVTMMRRQLADSRPRLLADHDEVSRIEAYTMMGDQLCDAYAALIPELGFKHLVAMLMAACDHGVDSVEDAPPQLVALIREMERVPDWIDMDLVRRGARLERNGVVNTMPFTVRGAFLATFINKYAALPMASTGALSEKKAARRVKETAAFSAVEPGGAAFKTAAMVRLMHSMVRFNLLRKGNWDATVYGVPIPQSDQMPAGMAGVFFTSMKLLAKGRTEFTPEQRASAEFARYRCHLLGLPQDLLPTTPQAVVDVMATRHATLLRAWDDSTCGALVRSTMATYLAPDETWRSRVRNTFERSFSKFFFIKVFLDGDKKRAADVGIPLTFADYPRAAVLGTAVGVKAISYRVASKIPGVSELADRRLVAKLTRLLDQLGHGEYTTDASTYRAEAHA